MQVPGFGLKNVRLLLKTSGVKHAEDLFRLSPKEIQKTDGIGQERAKNLSSFSDWDAVDRQIEKAQKLGAFLVSQADPHYPELLKQIYDPPVILWVKGDAETLNRPGIAVVGTRNPGRYGLDQAEKWSAKIAQAGLNVNSGLAYGIDSKAHTAAVENGGGTIAVMGSGIDWIYPNRNRSLADRIVKNGGVVMTEYPPGSKPDAGHFPERNRIVSGMSHGVLVVESGIKGGSMITARLALDQNREVFVLPHPLNYMKGEGCNYLIKTGQGKLVQSMDDITDELSLALNGPDTGANDTHQSSKKWESADLSGEQQQICETIGHDSLHVDQIAESLETEPFKLANILLELEMMGLIRQKAGKYFELR